MSFEKFEDTGRGRGRGSSGPMISLRKSGSIGINRAAMEEYFEDVHGAVMYYDEDENRVGIERHDDPDQDEAYTISRTNETGSIVPSAFLKRYDLVPEVTTQYEPEIQSINQNLELVTIDLDEPIGTYGSPDDVGEEADDDDADDEDDDADDDDDAGDEDGE